MPSEILLPSASRTTSQTTDYRGRLHGPLLPPQLTAVLDVTAVPGTDSVALVCEAYNAQSRTYHPLFRCAARTQVGKDVLQLAEGLPHHAPASAAGTLLHSSGPTLGYFRLRVEHSGTGAFTYSLQITY